MIQLLQHFEQLSSVFAQAVSVWCTEYGIRAIIGEVIRYSKFLTSSPLLEICLWKSDSLAANDHVWVEVHVLFFLHFFREIGQKSSEELAREASGVKTFASFLSELGTMVPELIIPNISVLITHLEGEVLRYCSFC